MRYYGTKYGNRKVRTQDGEFDSQKEAMRWRELQLLQRAGRITNLQRQVKFVLIPKQTVNGRCVERECAYYADFAYHDVDTDTDVVEDTKGVKTQEYIIKRKLMLWRHGIRIREI